MTKQLTNKEMAEYLDQDVPLQQLDNELVDIPPFMKAQLAYAKSKHSKQAKQKKVAYKKRWFKKGGK